MTTDAIKEIVMEVLRDLGLIEAETPTTPEPEPEPPKRITQDYNFRKLPMITKERFREITKGYPFEQESDAIWEAVRGRALPLSQSWMESRYGQDDSAQLTHNPLGLLWFQGSPLNDYLLITISPTVTIPLLRFPNWTSAFKEWARRMDDPAYKDGVYPQGATLGEFIRIYVAGPGPGYANGESAASVENYLTQTVNRYNRYLGFPDQPTVTPPTGSRIGKEYSVSGTSARVVLPFPLKQAIIPASQTNQRPGITMSPDRYVQHDTGNRGVGANAVMHQRYLAQGAPDNYGNSQQLSYHFTVDDKEAWQMIPVDEVAWHGGDGGGPCNYKGISCELCINADINEPKSRENAEILAAELMNALGITSLKKHQDCAGKLCPQDMLNEGYWPTFVQKVTALRASRK
jgi:hypothetical protein